MHPVELFELLVAMLLAIIALHYAAHRLGRKRGGGPTLQT